MTIAEMERISPRDRRGVFKFLARDTEDEKEIECSPRILQLTGRKYFFRAFIF